MVVLISNDNIRFDVVTEQIIASDTFPMLSRTLKNMMDICLTCETINVDVSSDVLQKIIEYCQLQYQNPPEFIDSNDDHALRDIVEHCMWHITQIKKTKLPINCEYKNKTIFRTWKTSVASCEEKIRQMMKNANISQDEIDLLWIHIKNSHCSLYCCPDDYNLYLKNSTHTKHIVPEWSENFLSPLMKDIVEGKYLQESFIGKLYFASEYLDIPCLCDDITTLLSNYIHNFIVNDTNHKTMIQHLFELSNDPIINPESLSILIKQIVP